MLWRAYFVPEKRKDDAPVRLQLPEGQATAVALMGLPEGRWGTVGSAEFLTWFSTLHVIAGDHLIVCVLDGEAKLYAVPV